MPSKTTGVNPRILQWARERAGLSVDEVAIELKKATDVIVAWEHGSDVPTYNQLEKLAYRLYKRPLAIFFFPEIPTERHPETEFRTLPSFELQQLSGDTRYAVRQAIAMQNALRELNDGRNPVAQPIFRRVVPSSNSTASSLAREVRTLLGVTVQMQGQWGSPSKALQIWRDLVQDHGVFVFKRSFKQRDVSGFCLVDREFPVIFVNNSSSSSRQIFTIFHELGHILWQTSGVTVRDDGFIQSLRGRDKQIEVFANAFAADVLVPPEDFERFLPRGEVTDDYLEFVALRYSVSREVVLRRLLDRNLVTRDAYERSTAQWNDEFERARTELSGGDYYKTQVAYLGERYLQLAFGKFYKGDFGVERLADLLNVRVKSIAGLEQALLSKAVR